MKINTHLALVFGLVARSFATPLGETDVAKAEERDVVNLESRAAGVFPASVNCGGMKLTRAQILAALTASFTPAQSKTGKTYPAYYGNKGTDASKKTIHILKDPAALAGETARSLREQPIGRTQTWTGGDLKYVGASMYRVIFDDTVSDTEGSYVGVVYHPDKSEGGAFAACVEEAAPVCTLPPTTRTRDLWDMMRRAVGKKPAKKPTKMPAACKKPTVKKPTAKRPTKKPTKRPTTKKPTKKPAKKPVKKPAKKPAKKTAKKPTKKPTRKPATKKPSTKKPKAKIPTTKKPKKGGKA